MIASGLLGSLLLLLKRLQTQGQSLQVLRKRHATTKKEDAIRRSTCLGLATTALTGTALPASATDFLWQDQDKALETHLSLLPSQSDNTVETQEESHEEVTHVDKMPGGETPSTPLNNAVEDTAGSLANNHSLVDSDPIDSSNKNQSLSFLTPGSKTQGGGTKYSSSPSSSDYQAVGSDSIGSSDRAVDDDSSPIESTHADTAQPENLALDQEEVHTVAPGETLWDIAAEQLEYSGALGDATEADSLGAIEAQWRSIYEENRELIGSDPDLIHPQTKLRLPQVQSNLQGK